MKTLALAGLTVAALAFPGLAPLCAQPAGATAAGRLGAVSFDTSCQAATRADFDRGVSLLHSFWYEAALGMFRKVLAADPDCAMAHWGEAMTAWPQINGWSDASAAAAARRALAAALRARELTTREIDWIHALYVFYDGFTAKRALEHARLYAVAMGALSRKYPDDLEAQVFYALALLAADPPEGATLVNPRKAAAILAPLLAAHPDHPGIAHYLIHACDHPQMAQLALPAARRYAAIAPDAPHALHMPGHIFARLGLWQDDIRSNLASKAAAERLAGVRTSEASAAQMSMGAENRLHAMEFLEYAYLQIGADDEAHALIDEARTVRAADVDRRYPSYYAVVEARLPALYALETRDWAMAAALTPPAGGDAHSQAWTLLAHVTAAAHLHDARAAQAALAALDALSAREPPPPAGSLGRALAQEIRAWAAFARGDLDGAVGLLRTVAKRQDEVGKGEVELPAREMCAEMLSLGGRAGAALREYQTSLAHDPDRFNALLGAGEAAEHTGDRALAARYYHALLDDSPQPTGAARERLAAVSAALARW